MSIVMRLIPASIAAKPLPRAAQIITLLSIFATVPLATANLLAQQQTQDLGEASLEELANITVYTASRHIQKVTDAPSSVTVSISPTTATLPMPGCEALTALKRITAGCSC